MRRLAIALSALALVATACAGEGTATTIAGSEGESNPPTSQADGGLETRGSITEAEVPPTTDAPSATDPPSAQGSEAPVTSAAEDPTPPSDLPDVPLIDLATGAEFSVASLVPSDTPILLWFWAPH
jgi:hypothetical protein